MQEWLQNCADWFGNFFISFILWSVGCMQQSRRPPCDLVACSVFLLFWRFCHGFVWLEWSILLLFLSHAFFLDDPPAPPLRMCRRCGKSKLWLAFGLLLSVRLEALVNISHAKCFPCRQELCFLVQPECRCLCSFVLLGGQIMSQLSLCKQSLRKGRFLTYWALHGWFVAVAVATFHWRDVAWKYGWNSCVHGHHKGDGSCLCLRWYIRAFLRLAFLTRRAAKATYNALAPHL